MSPILAVIGAGGHGRVVADVALRMGWKQLVFFDDILPANSSVGRWLVAGSTTDFLAQAASFSGVIVAIGENSTRLNKLMLLRDRNLPLPKLIHPQAYVSEDTSIDAGSVIFAGSVVQPGCVIGTGAIVNSGATVDHDCRISDGVHICPGAHLAGGVSVGEATLIGIGATVNQGVHIGNYATVGAGAAVVELVRDHEVVVGVPARPLVKDKDRGARC